MSQASIESKLQDLQKNLQKLITTYTAQTALVDQLKSDNQNLKAEVEELRAKVTDFQNQDKMAKLVKNTSVEKEESIELKHRLNEYIKEIDRCIAHLS
ncbi:hypothetical protein [Roseivirga pacifica]|uniref:hypothetical protein n=1 Tax=Roseivirga pacifica TaxID=1267423 RepID=UPI002094355B|nr:hypothetical protein [Roseivirga pacifica]|tara:strand:- start:59 stop:352 length:294 start_codon:yes stop_codon:yes gene_type:complete